MTKIEIKQLIANGDLAKAIEQINTLIKTHLAGHPEDKTTLEIQNILITNAGRLSNINKKRQSGELEFKEEQTTTAQLQNAILAAIDQVPDQVWSNRAGTTHPKSADRLALKRSKLLLDFCQAHSTHYTTAQLYNLHATVVQQFGGISEIDLDELIEEVVHLIDSQIPKTIQAFVKKHQGNWNRREELEFLEELSQSAEMIMDKLVLAARLHQARTAELLGFEYIQGGEFLMGASEGEEGASDDEKPQHRVRLSSFYMGRHPVTLAQFEAFVLDSGYSAYEGWRCDVEGNPQMDKQHPVIYVSWDDAKAYCDWLGRKHKLNIRLPREAEWEYACRAGTTTPFNTGANLTMEQANFGGFFNGTSPVGSYPPNDWGLYDMHGNVWEWCEDLYSENYYKACEQQGMVIDPAGSKEGSNRVYRGGGWDGRSRGCRSAYRYGWDQGRRLNFLGFRLALSLQSVG